MPQPGQPLFTAYVTADVFHPEDAKDLTRHLRRAGFYFLVANESISTYASPLAVYMAADGRVGLADKDVAGKETFFGFATLGQGVSAGERIEIISMEGGDALGFSGLTINGNYYLGNNGQVTSSQNEYQLGVASSSESIKIKKGSAVAPSVEEFLSSGTWDKPSGAVRVKVQIWGGGGSGGSRTVSGPSETASGGGGGAYNEGEFDADDLGSSEAVTIGSGGAGVSGNNVGNAGGNSSFGSHLFAYGGGRGASGTGDVSGGGGGGAFSAGSNGATGTSTIAAGRPGPSHYGQGGNGGSGTETALKDGMYSGGGGGAWNDDPGGRAGGSSVFGGGGGGGVGRAGGSGGSGGAGGSSVFGGSGGTGRGSSSSGGPNGVAGQVPGGGGGASTGGTSGAGGSGKVLVTTYFS